MRMGNSNDLIVSPRPRKHLAERLREFIVHNELPSGQRVDEKQLCERFGVSRTPLLEAPKVHAAEGLIKLIPNRSPLAISLGPGHQGRPGHFGRPEVKDGERLARMLMEHSRETGHRVRALLQSDADVDELQPTA